MISYQKFKRAYRTGFFSVMHVFVFIFIGMSLCFSVAAAADLLFGLNWGWTWEVIPIGVAFALVGLGFQWLLSRMHKFFEYIDP